MRVMKMMNKQLPRTEPDYQVSCAWCEAVIRKSATKDSHGMCMACYYRILREHISAYQPTQKPVYASER